MTTGYHESDLSGETQNLHRGYASLIEEIEAADWYTQRVDVCSDEVLKEVLAHNRDEELEHAAMLLEWLRRRIPQLDEQLRQYLFTSGPIKEEENEEGPKAGDSRQDREKPLKTNDLGIGKIK